MLKLEEGLREMLMTLFQQKMILHLREECLDTLKEYLNRRKISKIKSSQS
jgi:hypothetical protein